jgi:hypothetical protein
VPAAAKNDAVREMELYLGTMIRQVDSSLIEEWERMNNPNYQARPERPEVRPPGAEEAAADITRDAKAFTAAIRTKVFMFLRGLVNGDYEPALGFLTTTADVEGAPWTPERFDKILNEYHEGHDHLCLDPEARNQRHTYVQPSDDKKTWRVQQMLVDPEDHNDWVAEFEIDLAQSRTAEEPVMVLRRLGPLANQ